MSRLLATPNAARETNLTSSLSSSAAAARDTKSARSSSVHPPPTGNVTTCAGKAGQVQRQTRATCNASYCHYYALPLLLTVTATYCHYYALPLLLTASTTHCNCNALYSQLNDCNLTISTYRLQLTDCNLLPQCMHLLLYHTPQPLHLPRRRTAQLEPYLSCLQMALQPLPHGLLRRGAVLPSIVQLV